MRARGFVGDLVARGVARSGPERSGTEGVAILQGLEVAVAVDPREGSMRARWRDRVGNSPVSYLLVADDPDRPGWLKVLGPASVDAPIRSVEAAALARSVRDAAGMGALESVRHLAEEVARLSGEGLHMEGLLSRHTVEVRFKEDTARWSEAKAATADLGSSDGWRAILTKLGYHLEQLPARGYLARCQGRPVAVVHPKNSARAFTRLDDQGRPPEGLLVRDCHSQGARYGLLAHEGRFRLFDAGSTQEWLDLDIHLLGAERQPFLALLSPSYLSDNGFEELQAEARRFGAALRRRLDQTIRFQAFPALAAGLDQWVADHGENVESDDQREELEKAALTLMFRLLFILYAESSSFLPMNNATYRSKSLTGLVAEAVASENKLSSNSTALWSQFAMLVRAMRHGNPAWDVPAYNGALFAPSDFEGAELLERMEISDPHFARLLTAVGWDRGGSRGVDYSSLEIGHLGHIYEALLSLRLSVADRPLRYNPKEDRYVPDDTDPEVHAQSLLWQTNEGGRKSGGVYYTPPELVQHLVRGAVVPAFRRHLEVVRKAAATDPETAVGELFSFSVLDPACGSAHFLVQVVETLADLTVRFLAENPLPGMASHLDRLRAGASAGAGVDDAAILRRLLLKHCVFGVDVSPMGAEIAVMSLWLASFVPGLSLSYLDRNVIVGDSLLGVASLATVGSEGTLWYDSLLAALGDAINAVAVLADIDDRTPEEVEASKLADTRAKAATERAHQLFDLWTAQGFGVDTRKYIEDRAFDVMAGNIDTHGVRFTRDAAPLARQHRFLHWALAFPRVFDPSRDRPGFDVVVGNPPWEEVTIEELSFYVLHQPGINGLPEESRSKAIRDLIGERPELPDLLNQERERVAIQRQALAAGEYVSMAGDPDLYKYFCQRYRQLTRMGGSMGVVLPRGAFINKGSRAFRDWLFTQVKAERVDFLLNKKRWIFDTHPQYSVALVVAERAEPTALHRVEVAGVAKSKEEWSQQASTSGVRVPSSGFGPHWMTPLVGTQTEVDLLAKVRIGHPFPFAAHGFPAISPIRPQRTANTCAGVFPVRELDETNDRKLWDRPPESMESRPLWKGESFYQYDPHGKEARLCPTSEAVRKKVRKPRPGSGSLVAQSVPLADRRSAVLTELGRARAVFRDVSRSDDSRTVIACLVPPRVFLTNKAPYLTFVDGDEMTQAACLGIMNSLPFDWQARRFVEINVNFFILEGLVVPRLSDEDFQVVARHAARLSTVDDRFAVFAGATGVEFGPLDDTERQRLLVDIDARVARAWCLTPAELEFMFDDFTIDAVSEQYRSDLLARLGELI